MNLSNRRRTQLGVLLIVVGGALIFVEGFLTQLSLDAEGVRPEYGALKLLSYVVLGLGMALFLTSRRQPS
jgi:drug/metabolite transporter (DMT)-like permease